MVKCFDPQMGNYYRLEIVSWLAVDILYKVRMCCQI